MVAGRFREIVHKQNIQSSIQNRPDFQGRNEDVR